MDLFRLLKKRLGFTKSSPYQRRKPNPTRCRPMVEELESRLLMASGLVAAYNFDQGSGTTLRDVSGNGNNGIISNATWVSNGKFGGALQFTGSLNSMVTIPNSPSLDLTKGMTLEAWVKPSSLNSPDDGWSAAISKDHQNSINDISYALYAANGTGTPPAVHILRNGEDNGVQGTSNLSLNTWTFLAATYDGNTLKMYVNGNLVGSQKLLGSITTTGDPLHIGGDWSGEMFTGLIDNVRVYNTALSQSAIQNDMKTAVGAPVDTTPPTVTSVTPANKASEVSTSTPITVKFSEALNPTTVTSSTIQLLNSSGAAVAASVTYNASTFTATLTPSAALSANSTYTILVHGGTGGAVIKDAAGNALAANFSASFTTDPPAPVPQPFPNNQTPPPLPPPTGTVIHVSTASQLQSAVANLQSGQTILIDPGTYNLTDTLWLPQGISNVSIRGSTGKASDVVIQGAGMSGSILFGFWTGNVQNATFGDFTIQGFADHAFIFNAGAQSPLIHNVTMIDMGEQFVKSNPDGNGGGVNNGVVEYCTMMYSTNAPNAYTNGVDVHTGQNWIIRNNLFENIRAVGDLAGPAILIWDGSSNATVEGNTFINNQREIAFGLSDPSTIVDDNTGGLIANNFIYRSGGQQGDVGIGVWNSPNTEVAYNTVILNGDYVNAIEYRFSTTTGVKVLDNLTDAAIARRDGASAHVAGNVTNGVQSSWFVNEAIGDLHLTAAATGAIGKGQYLPEVSTDYDGQARPSSGPTDVGADEYQAATDTTPPTVTSVTPANGASGVSTSTPITVQFSEALDPTTVTSSTIQLLDASGNAVAASVTYNANTFTATLTPSTALSASSTYTILVHGGTSDAAITDTSGNALAANFSASFTTATVLTPPTANAGPAVSGMEGATVQFSGSASGGSGSLSYLWDFGDGSTATGTLTPSHTYLTAGTYTVTLTVTDSANESSQSTTTATVADVAPTANAGGPYSAAPGTAINFSGSGSVPDPNDTLSYLWNFGDGATSTQQSASHAYTTAGTYTVTFTVTASDGAATTATSTATIAAASQEPLLYQPNLQYVGAFRLPAIPDPLQPGDNTYDFGGTALAYNPANNSLFLVGMPYDNAISEISIPQSIVNSANLSNLATATVLQQPVQVLSKLQNDPILNYSPSEAIGGLAIVNGQLIGTDYGTYDGSGGVTVSHFVLSSLNLSTAKVGGLYQVGNLGGGYVGGYMTPIPAEWQAALGAPYLTGQADLSIISRTSSGPAAFGFDPSKLGSGVTPITPYVYYPVDAQLGPYTGPADPLQNDTTSVGGAVFVPGTSSVLFVGATGINYSGYGEASTFGDTVQTYKGPHSLNGQYTFQVWAYNANDFAAVKQGQLQPWQVQPYDVWNFTVPLSGSYQVGGVAFDSTTGRLYVSVLNADQALPYSSLPLIEVFQVTMPPPGSSGPAAPQIGTLAATPSNLAPGPISAGTSVTLTAGNVYTISPGASTVNPNLTVTQVAFYLETNKDGVPEPGTDQLLGYGAPSAIANANHNWTLTMSTAGLTTGTYTIYARALDSNGMWSDPITMTLTIA